MKNNKFKNSDFVHCHVHSEYSEFDGLSAIDKLVMTAREMGFPALGLTDHGNIGGWIKFLKACSRTVDKKGNEIQHAPIKSILGCLLSGQEIFTDMGVKNVENIQTGDMVLTHKGRFRKVKSVMNRQHDGVFYKIKLAHNVQRELILTDEHPILISDCEGNVQWLKPGEIMTGKKGKTVGLKQWRSYVCLPKLSSKHVKSIDVRKLIPDTMRAKELSVTKFKKYKKSNKYYSLKEWDNIGRKLELDEDMAYFLGLFCAEGWTSGEGEAKNGAFGLSFSIEEDNYVEFCIEFLKSRFNIQASISRRPDLNQMDVYSGCLPLAYILSSLCGENAKNKRVPSCIFKSSCSIKDKFVQGLIDGDGKDPFRKSNLSKQETIRVASRDLAWGFRTLLADMGHWSSVDSCYDKDLNKTVYTVPLTRYRKYARSIDVGEYILKPISEISKFYDTKDVYNFEVEEDNSYVSDFVLHNCEFYLCRKQEWKNKELQPDGRKGNRHLCLFAKNYQGYKNICILSEKSWIDGFYHNPRIDLNLLAKHSEGVICSTACLSSLVNANLLYDRYDKAKKVVSILKDIFKEDLFLEVMYHGIDSEALIIPDIFKLGSDMNVPVIASNDAHYVEKSQGLSQEVLMCMSTSNCLTNPKHLKFPYEEFYLKSAEEMGKIFGHVPQCIWNTKALADRIDSDDIVKNLFGTMRLPDISIPKEYGNGFSGHYKYLSKLAWDGMRKKGWDKSDKHVKALNKEMEDIRVAWDSNNYNFANYFLIEREIMKWASDRGILVGPGRGSGYASVLLHCIDVAYGVDPLNYDLLWERFLGFDDKRFITDDDFGFEKDFVKEALSLETEEEDEERDVEDDLGGVDRY